MARQTSDQPRNGGRADRLHNDQSGPDSTMQIDPRLYPKGLKVDDADMATLNIKGDVFHSEWNYTISPREP
jgi:hypothetical protein